MILDRLWFHSRTIIIAFRLLLFLLDFFLTSVAQLEQVLVNDVMSLAAELGLYFALAPLFRLFLQRGQSSGVGLFF
jgi:hypothetical protein